MRDICPKPLCHWFGERGHKQAECSRHRKRRPLQREKEAEAWQLVGHLVPPRLALLSSLPEPPE